MNKGVRGRVKEPVKTYRIPTDIYNKYEKLALEDMRSTSAEMVWGLLFYLKYREKRKRIEEVE